MTDWLVQLARSLPPELATVLLAALPIGELRLALPLALTVFHLPPVSAFLYAVLGNALPIPFLYLGLTPLLRKLETHWPWLHCRVTGRLQCAATNNRVAYERYGALAIFLFVLIPFPGTGVWTGTALAVLFGLPWRKGVPVIACGMLVAGAIVYAITKGVVGGLTLFAHQM